MNDIKSMNWIGDIRGTHIGTAFLELKVDEDRKVELDIRTNINNEVDKVIGESRSDDKNKFDLFRLSDEGEKKQVGSITFILAENGKANSLWELNDGAKGIISWLVAPSITTAPQNENRTTPEKPLRIVSNECPFGSVRMFSEDLKGLISRLERVFDNQFPVVIFIKVDGNKTGMLARELLDNETLPHILRHCEISIADNSSGVKKSININLRDTHNNNIIVSSNEETWTMGIANELESYMKRYTTRLPTLWIKYGLNINGISLLLFLVLMPDLVFSKRVLFGALVIIGMVIFHKLHSIIPYNTIYLRENRRFDFVTVWQELSKGLLAALAGAVVVGIFKVVENGDVWQTIKLWLN